MLENKIECRCQLRVGRLKTRSSLVWMVGLGQPMAGHVGDGGMASAQWEAKMRNKANWARLAGPVPRDQWPVVRGGNEKSKQSQFSPVGRAVDCGPWSVTRRRNAKQTQFLGYWAENEDRVRKQSQFGCGAGPNLSWPKATNKANFPRVFKQTTRWKSPRRFGGTNSR